MTARGTVRIDAAEFLTATPAELARSVVGAALPAEAEGLDGYYATRLPDLELNVAQAIAAVAEVVPSARAVQGQPDDLPPACSAVADMALRAALLAASDPVRHGMIERALDTRRPVVAGDGPGPGFVEVRPADVALAKAYFAATPRADWWTDVAPASGSVARLLAARDATLGLLLGAGMAFTGTAEGAQWEKLPPGLVLCGPGATLAPGQYWLDADVALRPGDALRLDIVSNRGLRRLVEFELRGPFRVNTGFTVRAQDELIELRLVNQGSESIEARIERLAFRK